MSNSTSSSYYPTHTLSALETAQYRLLRAIAASEPGTMDGSAYVGKSKVSFLLGESLIAQLTAATTVVDFGCGYGEDAIELVRRGCKRVVGVDIQEERLAGARVNAAKAGVADRCAFTTVLNEPCDAVVSLDAFEHFEDPGGILRIMHAMLRPGGSVYASFGPTWYHPLGGHTFSVFPWAHLLFSERALCAWRSHIRDDGATHFSEVAGGLNQMTISRFEKLVAESQFDLKSLECVPIGKLKPLHGPWTREWTTAAVRAVLQRL
jgi:SAM-dependent methyltransferase